MDVFVRGLPGQMTEKQVYNMLRPHLNRLGIKTFHCDKLKAKGCAVVTFLDEAQAYHFLKAHGQSDPNRPSMRPGSQPIFHRNQRISCTPSNKQPDQFLVSSLVKREADRLHSIKHPKALQQYIHPETKPLRRKFELCQTWCGQWDYEGDDLVFASYYQCRQMGYLVFGSKNLFIKLYSSPTGQNSLTEYHLEIPYRSIQSFTTGSREDPTLTFSLYEPPRIFEKISNDDSTATGNVLLDGMVQLLISEKKPSPVQRRRLSSLDESHRTVVSSCFCYRFQLRVSSDMSMVQNLKRISEIPPSISWGTYQVQRTPFAVQWRSLIARLNHFHGASFELKFQLQKLAQNGSLAPFRVTKLLDRVERLMTPDNRKALVDAVYQLYSYIPFPGPDTEPSHFDIDHLCDVLKDNLEHIGTGSTYLEDFEGYDHMIAVHKATVTPTGIFLEGPIPEVKNRVLRKYAAYGSHFLSVSFQDEDSEPVRHDMQTSTRDIYHIRFRRILESSIDIAGTFFQFLGFSHSSLRAHTCWFMAPFFHDGSLIYAREVIKNLGDFSDIRSPAKCAARIGQAFSQTLSSIQLPEEAFHEISDVSRNGRTFSDGCGTCSLRALHRIWDGSLLNREMKPTVLQVRVQGAKGVISLDSRLQGMVLNLRKSMIKFGNTKVFNVEICGSANRPLPMYLNRQLIKILEDLGVSDEAFLALQTIAIEKLRATTRSAHEAAKFLKHYEIGKSARLPWLIRRLSLMELNFGDDDFLRNTLELVVVTQLRELKHRARMLVENGVTLYGIMDETGFLEERQIYCALQSTIILGDVVVTRCPALHPGDVQCVQAIKVPDASPLRDLHNVVVFSSKGQRDLPSMLSGGDLDGDLYNIIYDKSLRPKRTCSPADYATPDPIDIGRTVEAQDVTNHFLNFMENDSLGRIATLHQIIADRELLGTFDQVCLDLAALHSDAVDFSKTGIPVPLASIPRYPKARPDFLASGPRALIQKQIKFEDIEFEEMYQESDELDESAFYSRPKVLYYDSQKILGKLYRNIDERTFFETVQTQARPSHLPNQDVIGAVWNHVRGTCSLIQWEHLTDAAHDIRDSYEDNLADTMMSFSTDPAHPVSEVEVFSGSILGKLGAQSKRQREYSIDMKKKHDRDVAYTTHSIRCGDSMDDQSEALERSIACLYVSFQTKRYSRKKIGTLVSFGWVAAAVCLKEVDDMLAGRAVI